MSIGKNIKTLREHAKLTQEQLSEKLHISSQAVSKWETSQSVPDTLLLPNLSKALGVSIDELFKENPEHYENLASKLAAIFQHSGNKEDFLQADLAYNRLFAQGDYTAHDIFLYGCLYKEYASTCYRIAEESLEKAMAMINDENDRVYFLAFDRILEIKDTQKKLPEAIDDLKTKYESNPENSFTRIKLITAYMMANQDDLAEKIVDVAIASGAEEWGLYHSKGCFHLYNRQEISEAIACYEKAWAIEQTYCNTLYCLYNAYKTLGNKEKAIDICRQWIAWYEERGASVSTQHVYEKIEELEQSL